MHSDFPGVQRSRVLELRTLGQSDPSELDTTASSPISLVPLATATIYPPSSPVHIKEKYSNSSLPGFVSSQHSRRGRISSTIRGSGTRHGNPLTYTHNFSGLGVPGASGETVNLAATSSWSQPDGLYMTDEERHSKNLGYLMDKLIHSSLTSGLTVVWDQLAVQGSGSGAKFGPDMSLLFLAPVHLVKALCNWTPTPTKDILHPTSGVLYPGETLLVLGRPGSGCTTFLRTLASYLDGYRAVTGQVRYSYLDSKDIQGAFRGEVAYLAEDDVHFPTLTVQQTMDFVNAIRAPGKHARPYLGPSSSDNSRATYGTTVRRALASALGLEHTYGTKVGDAVLRGVSGGEKKRVSLYEGMALTARVLLLDNPTRGLDSKSAAEVTEVLKTVARTSNAAIAAAMYQAGEPLFNSFDKVCLLNQGRIVYFGPADRAVPYFTDMGYEQLSHQTSADFLVTLTDPKARQIRDGYGAIVPLTPQTMLEHWNSSLLGARNEKQVQGVQRSLGTCDSATFRAGSETLKHNLKQRKARHAPKNSPFLTTWVQQIRMCLHRRYLMQIGNPGQHIVMMVAMIFQALIFGSVLYRIPDDTHGFFSRASALFFMLLFTSFMAQTEIMVGYAHRPISIRHKKFAVARPSADSFANSLLDIVFRAPPLFLFVLTMYFMCGLGATADQFFIALGTTLLLTEVSVVLNRFYASLFADMANAAMIAGLAVIDFALYAGYAIPRPSMVVWWKWLSYWNPMSMALEVLMTNEFRKLNAQCTQLVPTGGAYDDVPIAHRSCSTAGVSPGMNRANGSEYLKHNYDFDWANRWRLIFLMLGIYVGGVLAYAIACEHQKDPTGNTGTLLYARTEPALPSLNSPHGSTADLARSRPVSGEHDKATSPSERVAQFAQRSQGQRVFSFQDVCFDVLLGKGETRRLLHNVTGYVAPGQLTAIMGASGAGKTTLMNLLAQRCDTMGIVSGTLRCDGALLPSSFQQQTGYCEQMDTHLSTATVREALQFSALLRQSTGTHEDKMAWCEDVLELLGMAPWANALVGTGGGGHGLSVEQRKRLTIGVELAAKPELLLFLDEPTSGMDSLAAWSIVQLLRRLAHGGQSILCTIHQPSGELMAQFDRLILLQNGCVVYNGPVHNKHRPCGAMLDYFERRAQRVCGNDANPAEFMLDCVSVPSAKHQDWPTLYERSSMAAAVHNKVQALHELQTDSIMPGNLPGVRPYDDTASITSSSRRQATYGASAGTQFYQLTKRTWTHFWRNPTYLGSKFATNLIAGLFVGSSFWGQGGKNTMASLQIRMFSNFVANVLGVPLAQHMLPSYVEMRTVFETRERKAKVYSWTWFLVTYLLIEIPWNWFCALAYWICWEFMLGNTGSHNWSFFWFILMYTSFWPALAVWVQNMVSDAMLGGILFSSLYTFCIMFSGIVQIPDLMPSFWRPWMFDTTPLHYYMEAQLGNTFHGRPVVCAAHELIQIVPPPGQNCTSYMSDFSPTLDQATQVIASGGTPPGVGYWISLELGTDQETCGWCTYTKAEQYLSSINMGAQHRYRDVWIFALYIGFNLVFCFVTYYLFRVFSLRALIARWRQRGQVRA